MWGLGFCLGFRVILRLGLPRKFLWFYMVKCFIAYRGILMLVYILGLVGVSRGLYYLGFRVISRLRLARFAYGFVGFRVFQGLDVFGG